jgi:hypothetical protein
MDGSSNIHTGSSDWDRIFEVVGYPSKERIQWTRAGYDIRVGDFGWASPMAPKDKEGLIHLTGYDDKYLNIWYADFKASEVRYVGRKPTILSAPNPFPIKSMTAKPDTN